jgi:hypothetical protein
LGVSIAKDCIEIINISKKIGSFSWVRTIRFFVANQ